MKTHEFERPWQVMPAKIIKLALEHAEKDNDFDHQVAYLLLDIGVEAALKTYLINRGHNVEKIVFPELLKKVKEELPRTNPDLIHQIEDIRSFHEIRNTLYHKGMGIGPTKDYLKRYSDLAKRVIEEVIEVNLETGEKKYVVTLDGRRHKFEELINATERRFKYFLETCGVVAEKTFPAYGTREFAMRLKYILHYSPDLEDADPEDRISNRMHRLEMFNELMGTKQTNHHAVDFMLENIDHLYVSIALQQLDENWDDDWNEYINLDERLPRLLSNWKDGIQSQRLTNEQVLEDFEKIISWIETQQKKLDEWITSHMENVYREGMGPPLDFLNFRRFFKS